MASRPSKTSRTGDTLALALEPAGLFRRHAAELGPFGMMKLLALHTLRETTRELAPDRDHPPTTNKRFATPIGGRRVRSSARR